MLFENCAGDDGDPILHQYTRDVDGEALMFAGLIAQSDAIREGEVSSRELVTACLERIARLDPALNAFRTVYSASALDEADEADRRRASGEELPLLGLPVAIKDDSDVAGDFTLFGTGADDRRMRSESEVVRRLRGAGAVIVGKTNAPELLAWGFTESLTHGVTCNPWNVERTRAARAGDRRRPWRLGWHRSRSARMAPDPFAFPLPAVGSSASSRSGTGSRWTRRKALWTLNGETRFTLMPMLAAWNVTGQPAAVVPAGLSRDGLPLGVQIVGRPHDEARLLSLSAQLEAELAWADRRPPLDADRASQRDPGSSSGRRAAGREPEAKAEVAPGEARRNYAPVMRS